MHRIAVRAVAAVLLLLFGFGTFANARERLTADEMKAALRTEAVEEEGFIDRVLKMVSAGTIPEDMVQSTFQWARKKERHRFQYFKRGLIVRAAEKGIVVR